MVKQKRSKHLCNALKTLFMYKVCHKRIRNRPRCFKNKKKTNLWTCIHSNQNNKNALKSLIILEWNIFLSNELLFHTITLRALVNHDNKESWNQMPYWNGIILQRFFHLKVYKQQSKEINMNWTFFATHTYTHTQREICIGEDDHSGLWNIWLLAESHCASKTRSSVICLHRDQSSNCIYVITSQANTVKVVFLVSKFTNTSY